MSLRTVLKSEAVVNSALFSLCSEGSNTVCSIIVEFDMGVTGGLLAGVAVV